MNCKLHIVLLCLTLNNTHASTPDSARHKTRSLLITPRFNTLNMAPISGSIVNQHANIDITMVYTKNRFTWHLVNGVDLEDIHTEMNYFLTNVRYKINITKEFGISPFLAFYSEHSHQVFDPVSDVNGGLLFTYQHNSITVEAFALFVRLTHKNSERDMINRFEIRYKLRFVVLSGFVYQNTGYFDDKRRIAVGFRAILPQFKVFSKIRARAEVTGSFKISEYPQTKIFNGVFLSLAFPISA